MGPHLQLGRNLTNDLITELRDRYNWRAVTSPQHWRPIEPGAEIVGYYGGRTIKEGNYGQYEVVIVHVPHDGAYTLSGSKIIQLLDAALINVGDPIRVIWQGYKETAKGHHMKVYDLLVTDGEALPATVLPEIN